MCSLVAYWCSWLARSRRGLLTWGPTTSHPPAAGREASGPDLGSPTPWSLVLPWRHMWRLKVADGMMKFASQADGLKDMAAQFHLSHLVVVYGDIHIFYTYSIHILYSTYSIHIPYIFCI